MYKYKKLALYLLTFIYIVLSFIEFIKYMRVDSCIFGIIYLIINLVIIFLLVPCAYNYKKYFSKARISKLIIIIVLGIFNSYILQMIYLNNAGVVDSSKKFIDSIFIYKSVFKGIIYFLLAIFTVFEFKLDKLLKKITNKEKE